VRYIGRVDAELDPERSPSVGNCIAQALAQEIRSW
jgi:hypothetical protein